MERTLKGVNHLSEKILTIMVLNIVILLELIVTLGIFGVGPAAVGVFSVLEKDLNFVEAVKCQVVSFKRHFFEINKCCLYNIFLSGLMLYTMLVIKWSQMSALGRYLPLLVGMLSFNILMILIKGFLFERYAVKGRETQQNCVYLLLFSPYGTLKAIILFLAFSYIGYALPMLVGVCLLSIYLKLLFHQLSRTMGKVTALKQKQCKGRLYEN